MIMSGKKDVLSVYYDGSCPSCVKDRRWYEKLAGRHGEQVHWVDITGREDLLRERGIEPDRALMELHVEDAGGRVYRELDAYILLMSRVLVLKPLAWLLGLPGVRGLLSRLYRRWVRQRLAREGRLPETDKGNSE